MFPCVSITQGMARGLKRDILARSKRDVCSELERGSMWSRYLKYLHLYTLSAALDQPLLLTAIYVFFFFLLFFSFFSLLSPLHGVRGKMPHNYVMIYPPITISSSFFGFLFLGGASSFALPVNWES